MTNKTYKIDATGKIFGRLATKVGLLLQGKNEPNYQSYINNDNIIIIQNIKKIKFTGKKYTDKIYRHHTGYIGHLKQERLCELFEKSPEKVFKKAVYNMLPKNKLRKEWMKQLKFA